MKLADYLPNIYQETLENGNAAFLKELLEVMSTILLENTSGQSFDNDLILGFSDIIDRLPDYFLPKAGPEGRETPAEFLPWLATWVALSLREDWDEATRRAMIREIVSIYPIRGTRFGMQRLLQIYVGSNVTITDQMGGMRISATVEQGIKVGVTSIVGGMPAHYFLVNVAFSEPDPEKIKLKAAAVKDLIDREKPAHTYYKIITSGPTLQVGTPGRAEVGQTTLI